MDRKNFLKKICTHSACGCVGMAMFSPTTLLANNDDNTPKEKEEDWRISFMQNRIAKLIEGMDDELDKETITSLLENMGRHCAKDHSEKNVNFIGDLNAYLKSIEKWVEKIEHDEVKGTIKIVGVKNNRCSCAFVDRSKMPKEFCNCSKGWQKETYETIIGKSVDVKIDNSVLFGDERCGFTISYPV